MRIKSAFFLLVAASILSACATVTPTRFYTLVPPVSDAAPAGKSSYAVEVLAVQIPSQVDQPQIVIRTGQGELAISENHQWIAPLAGEVRAALSMHLTLSLGVLDVYRVPRNKGQEVYRVRTRIQRFESLLSKEVQLQAVWTIEPGRESGLETLTCSSQFATDAEAGYAGLTQAHQAVLKRLASAQAEVLAKMSTQQAPIACPN